MKTAILTSLIIMSTALSSFAADQKQTDEEFQVILDGGDISKIPVREEPGAGAEVVIETLHSKEVVVMRTDVSFKWTSLGYGATTHKVIVPQLAAHTVFNHRNPGEEGPCLRSDRSRFGGVVFPIKDIEVPVETPDPNQEIVISVKIQNMYSINREKNICKVQMIEDVRTTINDEDFYHQYRKDMGFRFIEDCPLAQ